MIIFNIIWTFVFGLYVLKNKNIEENTRTTFIGITVILWVIYAIKVIF